MSRHCRPSAAARRLHLTACNHLRTSPADWKEMKVMMLASKRYELQTYMFCHVHLAVFKSRPSPGNVGTFWRSKRKVICHGCYASSSSQCLRNFAHSPQMTTDAFWCSTPCRWLWPCNIINNLVAFVSMSEDTCRCDHCGNAFHGRTVPHPLQIIS